MKHYFIISRLQGFHIGHKALIDHALEKGDFVTVVIGSSNKSRSIKNPWTFIERALTVRSVYGERRDLAIVPCPDFDYNYAIWEDYFHKIIEAHTQETGCTPVILTSGKEEDAELRLSWAREIPVESIKPVEGVSATKVRELLLSNSPHNISYVPEDAYYPPKGSEALIHKTYAVSSYKKAWEAAPYSVPLVTTDTVVYTKDEDGKVWVVAVTRGGNIGKGLLALPGGFLEPELTLAENACKELLEETGLEVDPEALEGGVTMHVSNTERSEIGRVITTVFFLELPTRCTLVPGDDAAEAAWKPLVELACELDMFDDHAGILSSETALDVIGKELRLHIG